MIIFDKNRDIVHTESIQSVVDHHSTIEHGKWSEAAKARVRAARRAGKRVAEMFGKWWDNNGKGLDRKTYKSHKNVTKHDKNGGWTINRQDTYQRKEYYKNRWDKLIGKKTKTKKKYHDSKLLSMEPYKYTYEELVEKKKNKDKAVKNWRKQVDQKLNGKWKNVRASTMVEVRK